ncbi:MAG: hypothetical protein COC12_06880 [Rhodobacteraceae bacterium]|nr:MAG: hypothetical protein COC12_06880 [Paracoccaceae bacterium]
MNQEDRKKADDASITWRQTSKFPEFCKDLWKTLTKNWDNPLLPGFYDRVEDCAPEWWKAALTLTMVADMACERILQGKAEKFDTEGPFERMIKWSYLVQEKKAQSKSVEFRPPASLTMVADTSVVCVLPKMRIAPVGATLRNVSRNLSLLPGRGEVRCYWSNIGDTATPSEDNETLDILLIPEPRRIGSIDFVPQANGNRTNNVLHREKWNWDNFDLAQNWIKTEGNRAKFLADCAKLLLKAKRQSRCVNAVILPEYAVDYALFEQICDKLKVIEPRLEFVISGSSNNCHGQSGNMVLTRVWDSQEKPEFHITNSRRKHHRWRMDRRQVEAYALSSALNPKIVNWWENTPLGRRELYFHRFRKASVFSVLICEELARSDPCHEILRSVAPNLIFALLLDGPQIQKRWPAQYASNLADDPGSSVLTFTSYGLIERANLQGHFDPNFSIAMWKDDTGKVVEIPMPQSDGPRGVLLSLWPEHIRDITITGKRSEERAWRYSSHFPIVL